MAGREYTNQPQLNARVQRNNKLNETKGPSGGTVKKGAFHNLTPDQKKIKLRFRCPVGGNKC